MIDCNAVRVTAVLAAQVLVLFVGSVEGAEYKATLQRPQGFRNVFGDAIAGHSIVGQGYPLGGCCTHALVWYAASNFVVDLNPAGFESSYATAFFEDRQVGAGYRSNFENHALMWSGTPHSVVDLHPDGYQISHATDIWAQFQVGAGYGMVTGGKTHALLWNGTADSVVDLHPEGFETSGAAGVFGTSQVGTGHRNVTEFEGHALLWKGTADSVIDLHADGLRASAALSVFDVTQVGWGVAGEPTALPHALLWRSSADSAVDLHPSSGFSDSVAIDVAGIWQVGWGSEASSGQTRALVWTGTADSVVDLHQYLNGVGPRIFNSRAAGVDIYGNIIGSTLTDDGIFVVRWQVIPEPSTGTLLLACGWIGALIVPRRGLAVTLDFRSSLG